MSTFATDVANHTGQERHITQLECAAILPYGEILVIMETPKS